MKLENPDLLAFAREANDDLSFEKEVRPPGRLRHWWHTRMWGH